MRKWSFLVVKRNREEVLSCLDIDLCILKEAKEKLLLLFLFKMKTDFFFFFYKSDFKSPITMKKGEFQWFN